MIGITFYGTRPFIVQHQTNKARVKLGNYFKETYPEDSWHITDTNEHEIQHSVNLRVIFESEPSIVYEYTVRGTTIKQVNMWNLSVHPAGDKKTNLHHGERK